MADLLPCPFCGGEVSIALGGDEPEFGFWFITRGLSKSNQCNCRVFMESEIFDTLVDGDSEKKKQQLIEAWNRRSDNGTD